MKITIPVVASCTILSLAVVAAAGTGVGVAYNSEEHKLLADRGVAAVKVSDNARKSLPPGIEFKSITQSDYRNAIIQAKMLAAGFSTNNEDDYDKWAKAQDNCYFYSFGQLDYNKKLWVPGADAAPTTVLHVPGRTAPLGRPQPFTFGELVAFYGDYRKVPYCAGNDCWMMDGTTKDVRFEPPPVNTALWSAEKYCPASMPAGEYIAAIGSGLVPPMGKSGNVWANTAKSVEDYWNAGWWGDEMLRIAKTNDWHFSRAAVAWYVGMHRLALLYVDSARGNPDYWYQALHYEANALHSLTDLFAFGHVVTNSDSVSHAIVKAASGNLTQSTTTLWMENVITLGGGHRGDNGIVTLSSDLPAVANRFSRRDAFQPTDGTVALNGLKLSEAVLHDQFNDVGALVTNLRGETFQIFGDSHLRKTNGVTMNVIVNAVTASVQSLFDAYDALGQGKKVDDIAKSGSSYFAALTYLPAYIDGSGGYFNGQYTLYADFINQVTGANKTMVGWPDCRVPVVSGNDIAVPLSVLTKVASITKELVTWPSQKTKCVAKPAW